MDAPTTSPAKPLTHVPFGEAFLHALNFRMMLPALRRSSSPRTSVGFRTWGGIIAGGLFVLPSLFILIALAHIYIVYGQVPLVAGIFYGIKPVVTAIVLFAAYRIGSRALQNGVPGAIAAATALLSSTTAAPYRATRSSRRRVMSLACFIMTIGATGCGERPSAELLARGKQLYAVHCAACHGVKLEGQPNWRQRLPNGKFPAPPHDASGHTWHHADELLFNITKNGIEPYAPPGHRSDMPAFRDRLSDEEIRAVLAFIKSTWPEETRKLQAQANASSKR